MGTNEPKRRHGIVAILDALGASTFSEDKIKTFLSARSELNEIIKKQAKALKKIGTIKTPTTYTFGDTLIVVQDFTEGGHEGSEVFGFCILLQNYLYHSLEEGILFRGAFSVGAYIEDTNSNTVMGEAISDAAAWYEKSDWMGLASTPKTNNFLDFYDEIKQFRNPMFVICYPVPMRDGRNIDLYTISWAGRFFQDDPPISNPRKKFLELLKKLPVPLGTESKFENTKKYFSYIEQELKLTNV